MLKIKKTQNYIKRQLCEMLGVEFKPRIFWGYKHSLTNVQTGVVEEFKSARTGKPINVNGVNYMIKKLDVSEET